MKKLLLIVAAFLPALTASAYDYPYLLFTCADGTQKALNVDRLTLDIVDGKLVLANSLETHQIPLAELARMNFVSDLQGVDRLESDASEQAVEVFTLSGVSLGSFADSEAARRALGSGIYIVKQGPRVAKLAVR